MYAMVELEFQPWGLEPLAKRLNTIFAKFAKKKKKIGTYATIFTYVLNNNNNKILIH